MADSYSRVYRIGLLDDLHNYFPELLYNIESFQTVQDVLQYIRTRTTRRFNIFDNAMREYTNRNQTREPFINPQNVVHRYTDPLGQPSFSQPSFSQPSFSQPIQARQSFAQADYTSILIPLISSLGEPRIARPRVFYEDVVVHASEEIINQTTTQTTLIVDAEENCSVCQDQMKKDDSVRALRCTHIFHTSCIDPWLLNRSVLCPTCRHDIREDLPLPPRASQSLEEDEIDDYDDNLPANFINSLFARRHF